MQSVDQRYLPTTNPVAFSRKCRRGRTVQPGRKSALLPWVIIALFLCGSGLGLPSSSDAADSRLTYITPRGVTITITDKGLSSIRKGFGTVVDGEWTAFRADDWFQPATENPVQPVSPTERSIEVLSPQHARVTHRAADMVCVYDYTFEEEDTLITCRVENPQESAPIQVVGFSGLQVHFARSPEGVMAVAEKAHFQEHGLNECHPSNFSPIGGSYVIDREVGFGLSPWNASLFRTLILWDYANWNDSERDRVLERRPIYFAHAPIPPGGAVTVGLKLRVSPELDWKHLLAPYQTYFQKTFGSVQYKSDARWIAVDHLAKLPEKTPARRRSTTEEPASTLRGIATSSDAQALCDRIIPRLDESNGQGVILWGYGLLDGVDQTRLADFDVLPPDVEENWSRISGQFAAAGLKLGVATSPGKIEVRKSWTEQELIDINPHDAGHREMVWQRYQKMIERHCSMFYLDGFGHSLDDVMLMKWLRRKLGPDIQTFAESPCDAMLVYSGGYTSTSLKTGSSAGAQRGYHLTIGDKNWEILQWLVPGCQLVGQLTDVTGNANDALSTPERFFYPRQITPILSVAEFARAPALKKLQPQFVSDDGKWLETATDQR